MFVVPDPYCPLVLLAFSRKNDPLEYVLSSQKRKTYDLVGVPVRIPIRADFYVNGQISLGLVWEWRVRTT